MLSPCPSCSNPVSQEAATCPKCGHQFRSAGGLNLSDPVHILGVLVLIAIVVGVVFYIANASP